MAQFSKYQIRLVPQDLASSDELLDVARAFREIRLQSLQSDPASFSSTDFVERQKPISFFTKRLQNPLAKTFAVVCDKAEDPASNKASESTAGTWYGMLVLLGPQVVDPETFDNENSWKNLIGEQQRASQAPKTKSTAEAPSISQTAFSYHIVSVYVSSVLRGQGIGKDLFRAAFAEIEKEAANHRLTRAICTLGVGKNLLAAWNLYNAIGFVAVAEVQYVVDDGRVLDDVIMRKDFEGDAFI